MAIKFVINDVQGALVEQRHYAKQREERSETLKDVRFHSGRVSGLSEAIELVDAAQRSAAAGGAAVDLRSVDQILEERELRKED